MCNMCDDNDYAGEFGDSHGQVSAFNPKKSRKAPKDSSSQLMQNMLSGFNTQSLIISMLPWISGKLSKYPKLTKLVLVPLSVLAIGPAVLNALPGIWSYLCSFFMASMVIPEGSLQKLFKKWLEGNKVKLPERSVTAKAPYGPSNLSFSGRSGFDFFKFKNRIFVVTSTSQDLTIWTLGLSPQPIKDVLVSIVDAAKAAIQRTTQIWTPRSGFGWDVISERSVRPLDSVYLPLGVKEMLKKDVAEYLSQDTRTFYHQRGVPLRRGYLLYGPPGVGKSSLAIALAGHFNLDVFTVSLMDPKMSDSMLVSLFQKLPQSSVVLLEDVDSAGLGREARGEIQDTSVAGKKAMKSAPPSGSNVTLSGLLNALDGPSAPEGHLLLMTTNCPESLDPALTRAGRVDVNIEFKLADSTQIRDHFCQWYKVRSSIADTDNIEEENEEVARIAEKFAARVPEYKLSPAELQIYFLLHKKSAQDALDGVTAWVEEQLSKKAKAEAEKHSQPETKPRRSLKGPKRFEKRSRLGRMTLAKPDAVQEQQPALSSESGTPLSSPACVEVFQTPAQTPTAPESLTTISTSSEASLVSCSEASSEACSPTSSVSDDLDFDADYASFRERMEIDSYDQAQDDYADADMISQPMEQYCGPLFEDHESAMQAY